MGTISVPREFVHYTSFGKREAEHWTDRLWVLQANEPKEGRRRISEFRHIIKVIKYTLILQCNCVFMSA